MKTSKFSMRTRMIITFSLFITTITIAITALILSDESTVQGLKNQVTSQPSTVFYKTIGQAPDLTSLNDASEKLVQNSFTLEIEVAQKREVAERIIDRLQSQGIKAYYTPLNRGGQIVYRVRHGIYKTQAEAERASINLRAAKQLPNRVSKL